MAKRIPLRKRDGEIVAHAVVDDEDFEPLSQYRWWLEKGYVVAAAPGRVRLRMHRVVLGLTPGDGLEGDHRNGDRLDNRRSNLRIATRAQNAQNLASRGGTSRFRGVHYRSDRKRRKPWCVRIVHRGRHVHVGYFATEEEAGAAAATWYAEHFPFAEAARHAV